MRAAGEIRVNWTQQVRGTTYRIFHLCIFHAVCQHSCTRQLLRYLFCLPSYSCTLDPIPLRPSLSLLSLLSLLSNHPLSHHLLQHRKHAPLLLTPTPILLHHRIPSLFPRQRSHPYNQLSLAFLCNHSPLQPLSAPQSTLNHPLSLESSSLQQPNNQKPL